MTVLAASGDTWGIPGPIFLGLYLLATAGVVAIAVYQRIRLRAGADATVAGSLGAQQLAYLNGGPALAVHAALGGLRGSGAIDVGPDRRLLTTGPTPAGLTPLDQAIHWAAHQRSRARNLQQERRIRSALNQLRTDLEQRGLLLSAAQQAAMRRWPRILGALLLLGVVRLSAGLENGQPVGYLLLTLAAVLAAVLLLWRVPQTTPAGRRALRDKRRQHTHLAPASSPAYATYGAAGAAMGVALYGIASLWALDPGFAEQVEVQHQAVGGWSSSGYNGGTSDGGGSCGGGSSCGGGGGGGCGGGCGG